MNLDELTLPESTERRVTELRERIESLFESALLFRAHIEVLAVDGWWVTDEPSATSDSRTGWTWSCCLDEDKRLDACGGYDLLADLTFILPVDKEVIGHLCCSYATSASIQIPGVICREHMLVLPYVSNEMTVTILFDAAKL